MISNDKQLYSNLRHEPSYDPIEDYRNVAKDNTNANPSIVSFLENKIFVEIDSILKIVDELETRLSPVLVPHFQEDRNTMLKEELQMSYLQEKLHSVQNSLETMNYRLNLIYSRIEL